MAPATLEDHPPFDVEQLERDRAKSNTSQLQCGPTTHKNSLTTPNVKVTRKLAVAENGRTRRRDESLATFLTRTDTNQVVKQSNRYTLDNLRVPRRWISLRNVISVLNVIVLALSILTITLVSYFSGAASTKLAIMSMSNTTITTILFKFDGMFAAAERVNTFTEGIYSTPEYPVSNVLKGSRLLYFIMTAGTQDFDQMYVVAPDNTFSGIQRDYDQPDLVLVKYLNRTTRPNRYTVPVDGGCTNNDTTCNLSAFSGAIAPIFIRKYNASSRPFY